MMKSLYEELGGTYTLRDDGMLYPDLVIGDKEPRPIGKWGRMHMKYLEAEHPGLYASPFVHCLPKGKGSLLLLLPFPIQIRQSGRKQA